MRALERKLLRDLARMRGQALSIAGVVACGVAVFVASVSTYDSLEQSRRAYYLQNRFAHLFASLERAPEGLAPRLAALPGVAAVETRLVQDALLDLPGAQEPVVGRFVSVPVGSAPRLNRLHLCGGRLPAPGRSDEVLVAESFARAQGLRPGDSLVALLNGRRQRLRVVGLALSPEYIAALRPGSLLPDDAHFGVLWMGREGLEAALGAKGSFNDVALALTPDASEPALLRQVDTLLAPWGGLGATGRAENPSHRFVSDELEELRVEATVLPAIFLAVAAFLLNVVVGRLVATERTQIGTLKALGYGNARVGAHYLEWMALVTLAGAAVGSVAGAGLGRAWAAMYADFFRFPLGLYRLQPWIPLAATAASLAAASLGALAAVRRAARLPPAEAMQPAAPALYRRSRLERLLLGRLSSQQLRMVVRSVARRPGRTLLTALGVASATGIVVVGAFWTDSIAHIVRVQFNAVQREDLSVGFTQPVSTAALHALRHLEGVRHVEGLRAVQVDLRAGTRARRVELLGLPARPLLHPLLDAQLRRVPLPPDGLLLSERLATRLGVRAGDRLHLQVLEGTRRARAVQVVGVVDELVGFAAYMERGALNRLLGEGPTLSAALLTVDPRHARALYARLQELPRVGGVTLKGAVVEMFSETFSRIVRVFSALLTAFGAIIVVGVVYNGARILLAEKERELASLRVLGFRRREISTLLLGELGLQVALGIPLGLGFGYGLAAIAVRLMGPESMRLPLVVSARTQLFAAAVVLGAGALSALLVRRRLARLDLVAVLKTRE